MYKALFFKEWIKLRWLILILIGLSLLTFLKIFLNISAAVEVKGAYHLWFVVIFKKAVIYSDIKYIIPFSGIVLALAQFVPETRERRLRLLFHLPVNHNKSLFFMLFTGFSAVLFLIGINLILLVWMMSVFFPKEVVISSIITSAPWFVSGLAAYLGISLAVVEPAAWRKVIYAVSAFSMALLFFEPDAGAYSESLYKYVIFSLFYTFTLLLPAFRFKRGLN